MSASACTDTCLPSSKLGLDIYSSLSTKQSRQYSLAVYIHFPWCLQKCHYCDFYSIGLNQQSHLPSDNNNNQVKITKLGPSKEQLDNYLQTISLELEQRRSQKETSFHRFTQVHTIYFGGGTSSLMPPPALASLIKTISNSFVLSPNCEITLEGNPENLTPEYLAALADIGINRLSVGLQSFQANILQNMNRFYHQERYDTILEHLQHGPISNFSLDLIYGFPGQSAASFHQDLAKVLSIRPKHLSLYSLTVESNTAYGQAVKKKLAEAPDEDLQSEIWQGMAEHLTNAGMEHYEVSNYALTGHFSRHNLQYWLYEPYLSLGPGAHGFDGRKRYANPRNLQEWQTQPGQTTCTNHDPLIELPLMLLRLCTAVDLDLWQYNLIQKCGLDSQSFIRAKHCLEQWADQGFAKLFTQSTGTSNKRYFQWKRRGLCFLDERTLEMHQSIVAD